MENKLSKSLSQFMSTSNESSFDNPFTDSADASIPTLNMKPLIEKVEMSKEERRSRRKKDKYRRIMEKCNDTIDEYFDDGLINDFDGYVGNFLTDDEDVDLKRNLMRYGRKYARETSVSGETSEINKAYSESEKILSDLLDEINIDKDAVQKDITQMRMMRTRNYKSMSDLIESKAQFHNIALSIVKELNSMKKNQFELQMKVDKTKKDDAADETASNKAIQQLFGIGRDSILSGGYSEISGALEESDIAEAAEFEDVLDEDAIIHDKYFSSDEYDVESDGDKFLKYEGMGVHYILIYNDATGEKEILAEDNAGNLVPDYPLPGDPSDLDFDISPSTGTATDNLANQYEVRHI